KGVARVGVQFEIDANGILRVLARDTKTGQQKIVEMKSAVDVDDTAVQKMVEESVEHAFDDMKSRQWIEAKLRAVETAKAARNALAQCAGEIDAEYRSKIETTLQQVDSVLGLENPQSQSGDLARLRSALAALDEMTKPLADLLMDRAMEAMLRKRGLIQ